MGLILRCLRIDNPELVLLLLDDGPLVSLVSQLFRQLAWKLMDER